MAITWEGSYGPRADIVEEIAGLANNSAGRRWDSLIVLATSTRALRHCSKSERNLRIIDRLAHNEHYCGTRPSSFHHGNKQKS
jgi:hypothetical protein